MKNIFKKPLKEMEQIFKNNDIILGKTLTYERDEINIDELTGEVIIKGKIKETYPVEYWFPEEFK